MSADRFVNERCALLALIGSLAVAETSPAFLVGGAARSQIPAAVRFAAHTIDSGLTGGYRVIVTDLNRDGKPDIIALASGLNKLSWYENPGWRRHVIVSRINVPINAAAYNVDGDGIPEIAPTPTRAWCMAFSRPRGTTTHGSRC